MKKTSLISLVIALFISSAVIANTVSKKSILKEYPGITDTKKLGFAIIQEGDLRDQGFKDYSAKYQMTLITKNGKRILRLVRAKYLELLTDGDKSISIFDNPKDVKGTVFLTHTHKVGDDDQWLFLPALKRVKRISSSNKSGPYMGSEFSYEDLASQEVEKYTYNYLRKEACGALECYVIEKFPVDSKSGYSKQVSWIDIEELRAQKVDYYDRKKALYKTLTFADYHQYLGKYWRSHKMTMINHQNKKSTILEWSNFKFKNGFSETDFTSTKIKRLK